MSQIEINHTCQLWTEGTLGKCLNTELPKRSIKMEFNSTLNTHHANASIFVYSKGSLADKARSRYPCCEGSVKQVGPST